MATEAGDKHSGDVLLGYKKQNGAANMTHLSGAVISDNYCSQMNKLLQS